MATRPFEAGPHVPHARRADDRGDGVPPGRGRARRPRGPACVDGSGSRSRWRRRRRQAAAILPARGSFSPIGGDAELSNIRRRDGRIEVRLWNPWSDRAGGRARGRRRHRLGPGADRDVPGMTRALRRHRGGRRRHGHRGRAPARAAGPSHPLLERFARATRRAAPAGRPASSGWSTTWPTTSRWRAWRGTAGGSWRTPAARSSCGSPGASRSTVGRPWRTRSRRRACRSDVLPPTR